MMGHAWWFPDSRLQQGGLREEPRYSAVSNAISDNYDPWRDIFQQGEFQNHRQHQTSIPEGVAAAQGRQPVAAVYQVCSRSHCPWKIDAPKIVYYYSEKPELEFGVDSPGGNDISSMKHSPFPFLLATEFVLVLEPLKGFFELPWRASRALNLDLCVASRTSEVLGHCQVSAPVTLVF